MASVNITITLTDGAITISTIRDALMNKWGYTGNPTDSAAKLAFAKAYIAEWIKSEYITWQVSAALQADTTKTTAETTHSAASIT